MSEKITEGLRNFMCPYVDGIVHSYMNNLFEDSTLKSGNDYVCKNEMWMRNNILCDKEYSLYIAGTEVSFEDMLFNSKSLDVTQNIVIVAGERHIGKSFFVNKILSECKKKVENSQGKLTSSLVNKDYRIPIIVTYEWFQKSHYKSSLLNLIVEILLFGSKKSCNDTQQEYLIKDVRKLLDDGRFVIYFDGNDWLKNNEREIDTLLNAGRIHEKYSYNAKFHNLVLFTVDTDTNIDNTFLDKNNHVVLRLKKLTECEVLSYLKERMPDFFELAKMNDTIRDIMRYPEHLAMLEALYNDDKEKSAFQNDNVNINDEFAFNDYYIRASIKRAVTLNENISGDKLTKSIEKMRYSLQSYAYDHEVLLKPATSWIIDKYKNSNLLDESGNFIFSYCAYYLAMLEFVRRLNESTITSIPNPLLEQPLERITFWAGKYIQNRELFSKFWTMLKQNSNRKLLLLAQISKETKFYDYAKKEVYTEVFESLKQDFYDYSVLETMKVLDEGKNADRLKFEYSSLANYPERERNNIKKRMVYFLGISKSGILQEMLDELMAEETDLHLKYHIIRAAVENYGSYTESTNLIDSYFTKLERFASTHNDPIIRSDFSVLYRKKMKKDWMAPKDLNDLLYKLHDKLQDAVYWVRAHAAGAIGRNNNNMDTAKEAESLLISCVKNELNTIYNKNAGYKNSIVRAAKSA